MKAIYQSWLSFVTVFFVGHSLMAQWTSLDSATFVRYLDDVNGQLKGELVFYKTENTLFYSHSGKDTLTHFTTHFYLNKSKNHFEQHYNNVYVVQDGDWMVKCDSAERVLILTNAQDLQNGVIPDFSRIDFFKSQQSIQKRQESDGSFVLRVIYRDNLQFDYLDLYFDKQQQFKSYTLYFKEIDDIVDGNPKRYAPRLEIKLLNHSDGNIQSLSVSDFIDQKASPQSRYRNYEFIDFRKN
ncbi:MAG: hypothetical protein RL264_2223 [Bacteroidota bacterium]|jgi:hypothetical protein